MHPLKMDANSPNFLQPRHDRIGTVTLARFGFSWIDGLDDVLGALEGLPPGFVHNPYRGLASPMTCGRSPTLSSGSTASPTC
jgi:hypothetical protein